MPARVRDPGGCLECDRMWKPFSRQDGDDATGAQPAVTAGARVESSIAQVELMGLTAVATLTIDELTREDGAEQLADLLESLSETGASDYILDVQNVQFMDTACLGCLVEALNKLAARGGQIALACPNHNVDYVFRLTRLDRVFRICGSVMAALDLLEKTRAERK
ncbi:MAG: STAS domain-containing protein [Planctomycetes bacterium]|nr:STAS domain-containing protein [Planctomycetota bacterium]